METLRITHAVNNVNQNQHQLQTMAQKVGQGAQVAPGQGWGCVTDPSVLAGRRNLPDELCCDICPWGCMSCSTLGLLSWVLGEAKQREKPSVRHFLGKK